MNPYKKGAKYLAKKLGATFLLFKVGRAITSYGATESNISIAILKIKTL